MSKVIRITCPLNRCKIYLSGDLFGITRRVFNQKICSAQCRSDMSCYNRPNVITIIGLEIERGITRVREE